MDTMSEIQIALFTPIEFTLLNEKQDLTAYF